MQPNEIEADKSMTKSSRMMLARISQSRQRFGSYRHDLLVALRMLGSVEAEMMMAEWENWVVNESARCRQVERVLYSTDSNKTEGLKEWWTQYCPSCISAMDDLEHEGDA